MIQCASREEAHLEEGWLAIFNACKTEQAGSNGTLVVREGTRDAALTELQRVKEETERAIVVPIGTHPNNDACERSKQSEQITPETSTESNTAGRTTGDNMPMMVNT